MVGRRGSRVRAQGVCSHGLVSSLASYAESGKKSAHIVFHPGLRRAHDPRYSGTSLRLTVVLGRRKKPPPSDEIQSSDRLDRY